MKNKFKFSVAIPTYNNSKFLNKQLEIIFNNLKKIKLKNFLEVVISDNCSNDDTQSIVKKFKKKIKHVNSLKLNYHKNPINLGYPKNFINLTKILNGEYVIFLSDDDLPGKKFYIKLFKKFKNLKENKLFFFSIDRINQYSKKYFNISKFSHVLNRGAAFSGVMLKKNEINIKGINTKNLYIQSYVFNNCFIKNGFTEIDLKEEIYRNQPHKFISERFNDKMNRKKDFAVNDKIEVINYFYFNKKINFYNYFTSIVYVYSWALRVLTQINLEKNFLLGEDFFYTITKNSKVPKAHLISVFFLIYIYYFFNNKNLLYLKYFLKLLVKKL